MPVYYEEAKQNACPKEVNGKLSLSAIAFFLIGFERDNPYQMTSKTLSIDVTYNKTFLFYDFGGENTTEV